MLNTGKHFIGVLDLHDLTIQVVETIIVQMHFFPKNSSQNQIVWHFFTTNLSVLALSFESQCHLLCPSEQMKASLYKFFVQACDCFHLQYAWNSDFIPQCFWCTLCDGPLACVSRLEASWAVIPLSSLFGHHPNCIGLGVSHCCHCLLHRPPAKPVLPPPLLRSGIDGAACKNLCNFVFRRLPEVQL